MAECGEISMMLGAFEDSELEPNEMQEVAYHLARCESCTGVLADYSTLGRDLRSITEAPSLAGFSNAVIARIDRLPQPVLTRIERFFRRQFESVGTGFAWGSAVVAAAVVTIVLMTPYAEQLANRGAMPTIVASSNHNVAPRPRLLRWLMRPPASPQWRTTILMPTSHASSRRTILLQFGASPAGTPRSSGCRISLRSPCRCVPVASLSSS